MFSFGALLCGGVVCLSACAQTDDVLHEIANLRDPAWGIREAAARNLGKMGDRRAVPALIAALNDADPSMQGFVVSALAELKDPRAIEPLIAAARKDPDRQGADMAILALGEFKDVRTVAALVDMLNRSNQRDEEAVESSLGRIGVLAVPPLLAVLKRQGATERAHVLDALGWIDDEQATSTLIEFLKDPDPRIREAAVRGLTGHPNAAGMLLSPFDLEHWLKSYGQRVSPAPKDPRIPDLLIGALQDPDTGVRTAAAEGLGTLRVASAVDPLIALFGKSATVGGSNSELALRKKIAIALGEIGDPKAVDALIAALSDPNDDVRMWSARSLGEIKDRRATKPLIALISDKNNSVRRQALTALADIKDPSATGPLIEALRKESADIESKMAQPTRRARTPQELGPDAVRMALMTDPVLEETPYALNQIGKPAADLLTAAIKETDPILRQRVLAAMNGIENPSAVDSIIGALSDVDAGVRSAALTALAGSSDARVARPFMDAWRKAEPGAKYAAIYFLCRNESPWTTGPVIEAMREKDSGFAARCLEPGVKIRASIADAVIPLLTNADNYARRIGARTLVALVPNSLFPAPSADPAESRGENALQQSLRQRNYVVISAAMSYFVARGEKGSEDTLIEAMNSAGDDSVAEFLLVSGNTKLEAAGRTWLKEHNRSVDSHMFGPIWGQLRVKPAS